MRQTGAESLRDMAGAGPMWHSGGGRARSPRHHAFPPMSLELDQIDELSNRDDSSDGAEFFDAPDFSAGKDSSAMSVSRRSTPDAADAGPCLCAKNHQNPTKPSSNMGPSKFCSFLIAMDEPPPSLRARKGSVSRDAKREGGSTRKAAAGHQQASRGTEVGMQAYKSQVAEALRKGLTVKM